MGKKASSPDCSLKFANYQTVNDDTEGKTSLDGRNISVPRYFRNEGFEHSHSKIMIVGKF